MSQEDLTQFLKAVREDPSLQEKLKAEGADPVAIAKEAGFSITRAELIRHQAGRVQELSDEELEEVSGGCGPYKTKGTQNLPDYYGLPGLTN